MKILALDLGSSTGYALNSDDGNFHCGTKVWATAKELKEQKSRRGDRRGDIRILRFYDWLCEIKETLKPDAIVFEDVLFASSTYAVQLWSSFRSTAWLAFPNTLIEALPVSTLKKFATGSGAADKDAMRAAARKTFGAAIDPKWDDNAIDAFWLHHWATQNLIRAKV